MQTAPESKVHGAKSKDWPALARQAMVGSIGSAEENDPIGGLLLDIRGSQFQIGD